MSELIANSPESSPKAEPKPWLFKPGQSGNPKGRVAFETKLKQAFKAECMESLAVLVEIRDNKKAPFNVRMACCNSILDRGIGKPREMKEDLVQEAQDLLADEALQSILE